MNVAALAQPGVLTDPAPHAEYLTFTLRDGVDAAAGVADGLEMLANAAKSIGQKDLTAGLTATVGFSADAWPRAFPGHPLPAGLAPFPAMSDGGRSFPSTPGDVVVLIKSSRLDLNLQTARYVVRGFEGAADLVDDVQGFKYLDDRDPIDFVDGTENPLGEERVAAVLVADGPYAGGSHLVVQQYVDRQDRWDAQTTEQQEAVIGRTKFDDIELPDADKAPYAHNVKAKVVVDGEEVAMFRQNRAWGTAREHGTVFVGFAADASTLVTSLRQMVTADADGHYDRLLDFVTARTGTAYFVPPAALVTPS